MEIIIFLVGILVIIALLYIINRPPKYCERCGSQMEKRLYKDGYNSRTGEPIFHSWWACPNNSDKEPDEYNYEKYGWC